MGGVGQTRSAWCIQCRARYRHWGGLCRQCARAGGDQRTDAHRARGHAKPVYRVAPADLAPRPTTVITIGQQDYEVVWDGT